ncbi:hypothetical protein GCM10010393_21940 [Streptomyces gobitricini]|uniref:RDD family protein n=1 Tax=Streptomyces gobitricini TaxID=68211 RepID=A0ABP5Z1E4_9ACTN
MPGRAVPAIPISRRGVVFMIPVEYKPARRNRFRTILVDVSVSVVANLVVTALTAAAHLVF